MTKRDEELIRRVAEFTREHGAANAKRALCYLADQVEKRQSAEIVRRLEESAERAQVVASSLEELSRRFGAAVARAA